MNVDQPTSHQIPQIARPHASLLTYYFLSAFATMPAVVIVFPFLWIRYATLRYELLESGIRMSVGFLFRKEVIVAYRRIQDIHVSCNLIQRWLGISSVSIQTASGNATPEIVVEGVADPARLRDWLYERTRGAKHPSTSIAAISTDRGTENHEASRDDEVTMLLQGIRNHLETLVERGSQS